MDRPRIAVVGAGLIGRRHIEELVASTEADLTAVVDPGPAGPVLAAQHGVPLHHSLAELLAGDRPDGVILATPNRMHVDGGLECVAAGVPVIVEKPIGDSIDGATRLVEAGDRAGVPIMTGHHRNHSPVMAAARAAVASGALGDIVAVTGTALFHKPDGYFDVNDGWRRRPGGGPILLNLIHDVNCLMSLAGDIVRVQATTSSATRGFPVEDTAAMVFTFANGALGTFLLSDTAASPRSWEQTSGENADYPTHPDEDCYHLAGTRGSLSVPSLRLRDYPGERSWYEPFRTSTIPVVHGDPLANQIAHFADVIRGTAEPVCSGRDGLAALRVVDAVLEAARTARAVGI
ncbi:Gfo/Idh/MocA family protein [Pseudonocardia sp. CA-107938]|uniref:Gfo/Idh/MocA family protein n=1 Tax=Pseudonocardia sp. CA-107938 TaxID=3240021 RepID=UPI003D90D502